MKPEELKILDLLCDMGIDVNGNSNLQPWKAYDIDEVNLVIKDLEAENERLKGELEKRQQELMGECELRITIEQIRDGIEKENATLRKENATLRKENAKLRCLALHGMIGYAACKMNVAAEKYKDDEMSAFAVPTEFSKWHRKEIEWAKAYRKAKQELMEGKS